jgi:hypothetical protein
MATPDGTDVMQRLRTALETKSRRPPLYRVLAANHAALSDLIAEQGPNWQVMTEEFTAMGLLNSLGGELTAATVRQSWYRVCARKARSGARKSHRPASVEVLAPSVHLAPAPPAPKPALTKTHDALTQAQPAEQRPNDPLNDPLTALALMQAEMNHRSGRT